MLICFNYVGVVTEALTAKELVDLFWYEVDVDPVLFFIVGVSREDIWEAIQDLVDELHSEMFGEGKRHVLCWRCCRGRCLVK